MGVPDLLGNLSEAIVDANIFSFCVGTRVGIDMSALLHALVQSKHSLSDEAARDLVTRGAFHVLEGPLSQFIKQLVECAIYAVFVLETRSPPIKSECRRSQANLSAEPLSLTASERDINPRSLFTRSHELMVWVSNFIAMHGLPFVCAPLEADAQLVSLERDGLVDAIWANDSDLIVLGARNLFIVSGWMTGAARQVTWRSIVSNAAKCFGTSTFWDGIHTCGLSFLVSFALCSGCDFIKLAGIASKTFLRHACTFKFDLPRIELACIDASASLGAKLGNDFAACVAHLRVKIELARACFLSPLVFSLGKGALARLDGSEVSALPPELGVVQPDRDLDFRCARLALNWENAKDIVGVDRSEYFTDVFLGERFDFDIMDDDLVGRLLPGSIIKDLTKAKLEDLKLFLQYRRISIADAQNTKAGLVEIVCIHNCSYALQRNLPARPVLPTNMLPLPWSSHVKFCWDGFRSVCNRSKRQRPEGASCTTFMTFPSRRTWWLIKCADNIGFPRSLPSLTWRVPKRAGARGRRTPLLFHKRYPASPSK